MWVPLQPSRERQPNRQQPTRLWSIRDLKTHTHTRQRLRSSSSSSLIVSRTQLLTVGDRAFPVAAARVWNSLSDLVTSASSVAVFRSQLKTHLFIISYPLWLYSIGLCSVLRPRQHSIGYMGDGFYRSKDPTNSIKVLKEDLQKQSNDFTLYSACAVTLVALDTCSCLLTDTSFSQWPLRQQDHGASKPLNWCKK